MEESLPVPPNQLFLPFSAISDPTSRPVYDFLMRMKLYNLVPSLLREREQYDPAWGLAEDGEYAASVLKKVSGTPAKDRIFEYLKQILPALLDIDTVLFQDLSLDIAFQEEFAGTTRIFWPREVSDGTIRALGILLALFQPNIGFVGIEEPEIALHPGASAVLLDALREASEQKQVLVTTHSPDLLDLMDLTSDTILAVSRSTGATVIGPIDAVGMSVIREGLYKPGELMRMEQLVPDPDLPDPRLVQLFDLERA